MNNSSPSHQPRGVPQQPAETSRPRLSVLLTVYNRTDYLSLALDSVLSQTYDNYEILVIDDSGVSKSREIARRYGHLDRIMYIANPATFGIAVSIAKAVRKARGDYVAILNDDDLWEPNLLAELVGALEEHPECVLAFSDHWLMDHDGQIDYALSEAWSTAFARSTLPEGIVSGFAEFAVLRHGVPIANSALFQKQAIDWSLVVPSVAGSYDYWIACLLAATKKPAFYIPKRLARYRVHPKMETRRPGYDKEENLVYILTTLLNSGWFPQLSRILKTSLAEALFQVGRHRLHFDEKRAALGCFSKSFLLTQNARTLLYMCAALLPRQLFTALQSSFESIRLQLNTMPGFGSSCATEDTLARALRDCTSRSDDVRPSAVVKPVAQGRQTEHTH